MNPEDIQLRDCGHFGPMLGICQYDGCAAQLCPHCLNTCETCRTALCPAHQQWMSGGTRVFCHKHAKKHLLAKLIRWILPTRTQSRENQRTPRDVVSSDIDTVLSWLGRRRNR